ncbi:hypothetical protein CVIRNUC_010815 [Coccomyxa viridis]|uniref:Uncharacterized protein n=1 Tax=Coccomyxa viridis TaxID=1274662 RepID=A0AAV1IJT2_9CHLO|nr:hypothetical protein CVIRNUC_010815 [Coccomyxa viridis]
MVSVDSIRGSDEVTVKAVSEVAFTGIKSPKLGVQMTLKRVLEQLQQGVATADYSMDRRHGEGQAIANIRFREFQADMVGKYGDAAWGGLDNFIRSPDCQAEVTDTLDTTWALISDKPDAMKLYGAQNGKGYTYKLERHMRRIFLQAKEENQKMKAALVATPSVVHGNGENADPNEDANNVAPDP